MLDLERGKGGSGRGGSREADGKWNSEGSTLNNTTHDRRSRWNFLGWSGGLGVKGGDKVGKSEGVHEGKLAEDIEEVEGSEKSSEESEKESEKETSTKQHIMTAYVSSSEEVREENAWDAAREAEHAQHTQPQGYQRRPLDTDEESLTVPRMYTGDSESIITEEDWRGVGYAR